MKKNCVLCVLVFCSYVCSIRPGVWQPPDFGSGLASLHTIIGLAKFRNNTKYSFHTDNSSNLETSVSDDDSSDLETSGSDMGQEDSVKLAELGKYHEGSQKSAGEPQKKKSILKRWFLKLVK